MERRQESKTPLGKSKVNRICNTKTWFEDIALRKTAVKRISCRSEVSQIPLSQCRKCNSLLDLRNTESPQEEPLGGTSIGRLEKNSSLAWRVYSVFLRNLLKKNKEQLSKQLDTIEKHVKQNKQQRIQIDSLKTLLKSEDQVVISWAKEMYEMKKKLEVTTFENGSLQQAIEGLNEKKEKLEQVLEEMQIDLRNSINSMQQLKSDAGAFELQLQRERESVVHLKKERDFLNAKCHQMTVEMEEAREKEANWNEVLQDLEEASRRMAVQVDEERIQQKRLLKNTTTEVEQLNKDIRRLMKENNCLREKLSWPQHTRHYPSPHSQSQMLVEVRKTEPSPSSWLDIFSSYLKNPFSLLAFPHHVSMDTTHSSNHTS